MPDGQSDGMPPSENNMNKALSPSIWAVSRDDVVTRHYRFITWQTRHSH